jgi:Flp pilus assembly pilin Flp
MGAIVAALVIWAVIVALPVIAAVTLVRAWLKGIW